VDEIACENMMHVPVDYLRSSDVVNDVHEIAARITASGGHVTPGLVSALRASTNPTIAANATLLLELAQGTLRADRLGKAGVGWLFTSTMAEQCTHPMIAEHHAGPFRDCRSVLEICTGAGRDAAAMALVATSVVTLEHDPLVAAITQGNLYRAGLHNVGVRASAWPAADIDITMVDGVWADPSRRREGARTREAATYDPPLGSIPNRGVVGIKVGPGDVVDGARYVSEYVGYGRECRERILWRSPHISERTVTLVDAGVQWSWTTPRTPLVVPQAAWVIEPHNALIASGGVGTFLAEIGAGVFDPHIAYGALNAEPPASPWYDVYRVVRIDRGISVRRIQESIREFGWGPATIFKKRGWDRDPEDLRRALDFPGATAGGVVIVMRVGQAHQTVYATKV
jgi:hypothetical protein